jgi:hypothetical protein
MTKVTVEETAADTTTTDEVEDLIATEVTEEISSDEGKTTADETSTDGKTDEVAADEVVVTIGDEAPPQEDEEIAKAPEWVRELRKSQRELSRQNKELQRQLADKEKPNETVTLGAKPKMSDPDIDYDADKFEEALTKWNEAKQKSANELVQRQAADAQAQTEWQMQLNQYGEQKTQLKVKDYADVEATVSDALNATQQGIIVKGADNAALVIYALGKNSLKLKTLSAITDPVKFAFAIAKLEKDLKVTTRKAPPPPEKTVSGSAPKSGVVDSQLERLRAEAEKTGDYSKVSKYRNDKRKAS